MSGHRPSRSRCLRCIKITRRSGNLRRAHRIDSTQIAEAGPQGIRGRTAKGARTEKSHLRKCRIWARIAWPVQPEYEVDTGLTRENCGNYRWTCARAGGFHLHRKSEASQQRAEMGHGSVPSIMVLPKCGSSAHTSRGNPVRLTGRIRARTFSQRHSVLIDTKTEHNYLTLSHLSKQQAFCEITTLRFPRRAAWFRIRVQPTIPRGAGLWRRNSAILRTCAGDHRPVHRAAK